MKPASLKDIKTELKLRSLNELQELCLQLSRFKKENKAFLTYLLFESENEAGYVVSVKREVDEKFEEINIQTVYYTKKSVRKILRAIKTYIRYSKNRETEIQLLLYFCEKVSLLSLSIKNNQVLKNIQERVIDTIRKKIVVLHEDLQYDYEIELEKLV